MEKQLIKAVNDISKGLDKLESQVIKQLKSINKSLDNRNVDKEDYLNSNEITEGINNQILKYKKLGWSTKDISDKWHTFEELYYHRMILFLTIQLAYKNKSWKSKQHHDGTMFDDSFIVGINTPEGQYSYHYDLEFWDMFKEIKEIEYAPEYDGHKPSDITRLLSIL